MQYSTQLNELCFLSRKATLPFLSPSVLLSMWPLYIGPFYYSNSKWREKTLQFVPILFCFFFSSFQKKKKRNKKNPPKTSSAIQLVWFCTWALQWFTLTAVIFFIGGNWKFRDTEWPLHAGRNKSLYFQLPLLTAKLLFHPPYSYWKLFLLFKMFTPKYHNCVSDSRKAQSSNTTDPKSVNIASPHCCCCSQGLDQRTSNCCTPYM